jgi:HD superfamily phosphohydrolase
MIRTVEENGVRAFESMLLARYHMIDQVYYHKTKAGFTHYLEQAILTEEVPLSIPSDPYLYADIRDGGVMESLFEAGDSPSNYWSHHLVRRLPAKRILRLQESSVEDMQTLAALKSDCDARGIRYFTHAVDNRLSKLDSREDAVMRVAKKTLQGIKYVPIGEYSDLLQKYNERIKFTDFFVLREDVERFGHGANV